MLKGMVTGEKSEDDQIDLPSEPQNVCVEWFCPKHGMSSGRNANLGSDHERQQIMAGVSWGQVYNAGVE